MQISQLFNLTKCLKNNNSPSRLFQKVEQGEIFSQLF